MSERDRQRVGRAIAWWGGLTLGGVAALGVLVLWHLRRRGHLIRTRRGPARLIEWPELDPDD